MPYRFLLVREHHLVCHPCRETVVDSPAGLDAVEQPGGLLYGSPGVKLKEHLDRLLKHRELFGMLRCLHIHRWFGSSTVAAGGLAALLVVYASFCRAEPNTAPEKTPSKPHSLQSALGVNVAYCQEWLDGGDLKSLKQTAEGLLLLTDLLQARGGNDDWQAGVSQLRNATEALVKAAAGDNANDCRERLAEVDRAAQSLAKRPFPSSEPKFQNLRAAAGLRAMMVLLDGTHADAKRSVVFGEFADARSSAEVLAELGPLLASYRGDAQWKERTAAFVEASRLAARLEGKDPQAYRMALGTIYNRCEACHNRR